MLFAGAILGPYQHLWDIWNSYQLKVKTLSKIISVVQIFQISQTFKIMEKNKHVKTIWKWLYCFNSLLNYKILETEIIEIEIDIQFWKRDTIEYQMLKVKKIGKLFSAWFSLKYCITYT